MARSLLCREKEVKEVLVIPEANLFTRAKRLRIHQCYFFIHPRVHITTVYLALLSEYPHKDQLPSLYQKVREMAPEL